MLDPAMDHIARAQAYRALSRDTAPGHAQATLRTVILNSAAAITDDTLTAWHRIRAVTEAHMPPDPDDLSLMLDAVAMRCGYTSRSAAWHRCGIHPDKGREYLSARGRHAVTWPIWLTLYVTATASLPPCITEGGA